MPSREEVVTALAGMGLLLWALFLPGVLGYFLGGRSLAVENSLEAVALAVLLVAGVLMAEWPWRNPVMKALSPLIHLGIAAVAVGWLVFVLETYSIVRDVIPLEARVTEVGGQSLSPFQSGVWTMKDAVDSRHAEAWLPILVLFLQVGIRGVRDLLILRRSVGALDQEGGGG